MIAVVASMEREVSRLRRTLDGLPEAAAQLHVTGVGKERALEGLKSLLDSHPRPQCILSLGFAGALREDLETGDLVVSQRLHGGQGSFAEADTHLLSLAREVLESPGAPRHFLADTLTVSQTVSSPREKRALALASGAWVSDMEDFWLGQEANQRGIPFLSVRAVLDTSRQRLPPFVGALGDKRPLSQALHVVAHSVANPRHVTGLVKLSRQVGAAQESLAIFGLFFIARMMQTSRYAVSG